MISIKELESKIEKLIEEIEYFCSTFYDKYNVRSKRFMREFT